MSLETLKAKVQQLIEKAQSGGIETLLKQTITEASDEDITVLRERIFSGCTQLTDVYFPNVETIEARVFYNCTGLKAITSNEFPKLKQFSGEQSFFNCTSVIEVDLPLLETIKPFAFQNCSGFESVNLPILQSVPGNAFRACAKVNNLKFPKVTSVDNYAFYVCRALDTLILSSETLCELTGTTKTFEGTPIANGTGYIYVPSALIEDYKVATNWVAYATQFRAIEDYPEVCGGV